MEAKIPARIEQSPLLRLPVELRLLIFRYLLPSKHTLSFTAFQRSHYARGWRILAKIPAYKPNLERSLLEVCKQISAEAHGILYGENYFDFKLNITDYDHPNRVNQARLRAILNPRSAGLVKHCVLKVETDSYSLARKYGYLFIQDMFDEFTQIMADNHNLQSLRVSLLVPYVMTRAAWSSRFTYLDKIFVSRPYLFEPLAGLHGIKEAIFQAPKPCDLILPKLQKLITAGERPELTRIDYPNVSYKRRCGYRSKVDVTRTKKRYHDPVIDWELIPETRDETNDRLEITGDLQASE